MEDDSFDDDIVFERTKPAATEQRTSENAPEDAQKTRKRSAVILNALENREAGESDDSFDDDLKQCEPKRNKQCTPSPVKPAMRRRSPKILLDNEGAKPAEGKDSGVPGFPVLFDDSIQQLLTVNEVTVLDSCVQLACSDGSSECTVYLQDMWSDCRLTAGMRIRLIDAQKWGESEWLVSQESGVAIVEPDTLMSCTSVVQAMYCPRKSVLSERFRGGCHTNKAMLMGCIIHELFQTALSASAPITSAWLLEKWRESIEDDVMISLSALNFTPMQFAAELEPYVNVIVSWMREHYSRGPRKPIVGGSVIEQVHDIEENIWQPTLGLKGKIDVSLETHRSCRRRIEPLELKTGKSNVSADHSGQVLMYCMMLSAQYGRPIESGALLYLKDGVSREVVPKALELKGVLSVRNRIAAHAAKIDPKALPGPRTEARFCDKCDYATECAALQAVDAERQSVSVEADEFAKKAVEHLQPAHLSYFSQWVGWLHAEWREARRGRARPSDLWNKGKGEREQLGHCLSSMRISACDPMPGGYRVRFERAHPLREGVFSRNEMCLVTVLRGKEGEGEGGGQAFASVMGPVLDSDASSVSIRSDKRLALGCRCHLDKYESQSTFAMNLSNVALLMGGEERSTHLRSLIIDLSAPGSVKMSSKESALLKPMMRTLNHQQARAVVRALLSSDYSLIEGLPGSGKTTTMSVLVRCLVALGKSVLVTAYTHSAVDNLMQKLIKDLPADQMLRLGRSSNPAVECIQMEARLGDTPREERYAKVKQVLKKTPVVACTCLAASTHSLFSWRKFDVCVVDEASLVLESTLIAPLVASKRFTLVGDVRQLAPLVQCRESRDAGMAVSLFERLRVHPQACVQLTKQFRMNSSIAALSSSLFYSGELVCANDAVAGSSLGEVYEEKGDKGWEQAVQQMEDPWRTVLSGRLEDSVVFFDTASDRSEEYKCSPSVGGLSNVGEAALIVDMCARFEKLGVPAEEIGVMCVYRKQVDVIRTRLPLASRVEVNTVDQFQGRDKEVCIWSLVWTEQEKKSELLRDDRRVNVAVTRAKRKLVVVGCGRSMGEYETMTHVVEMCKRVHSE